ncbi:hypothetical protein RRF57_009216 [Xylaria bambusicola]|uniref:Uncharacterized protein n=1 Tax=Xylaria bambusicola TaxID=326684 RepID=A0AAN7Z8U0_9PEZI
MQRPYPSSIGQDDAVKRPRIGSIEGIAPRNIPNHQVPLTVNEFSEVSQPSHYHHEFWFQSNFQGEFDDYIGDGISNTLLNPIENENLVPEDVFYQPPHQFNSILDDAFFYDHGVQNEQSEEPSRSMELDTGIGNLTQYDRTGNAIVQYETDLLRHDHSVFIGSQADEAGSETPVETITDESIEVCNNYDTCFGVYLRSQKIVATPNSCYVGDDGTRGTSIRLKPLGGSILLHDENTKAHLGSLSNSKLASTLFQLPLRLDATLSVLEVKDTKEKKKPQTRKHGAREEPRESIIRIILHGPQNDKDVVGDVISDTGIFLQHPYADEVIPGTRYDNPHYLARPGVGMPKLDYFNEKGMNDPTETALSDETRKGRFIRIFETAEADGGSVIVTNMALSPRLRSPLMRHQVLALAMMQEKECGFVEEPIFPSLWRKEISHTGNSVQSDQDIHFGIIDICIQDMGLGKTLSMLALICTSLDYESPTEVGNPTREHQGTLIIAPKSTIGNWVQQVEEHIHERGIRITVYHGSNRKSLNNQFGNFDIIITTYETVRTEFTARGGAGPLFSWKWLRVALDEGKYIIVHSEFLYLIKPHHIRNRSSQTFRTVCNLSSRYRWCLTGTPIHNSLDDYGSLLSFIRVFPFINRPNFHSWVVKPVEEKNPLGIERLQRLIRATCLRRMKEKILSSDETRLPPRFERVHEVDLHKDDQTIYDILKSICAEKASGLEKRAIEGSSAKSKDRNLLVLINSLRLICDHGEQLLPRAVKDLVKGTPVGSFNSAMTQAGSDGCSACGGEVDNSTISTGNQVSICSECAASEEGLQSTGSPLDPEGNGVLVYRPSAKVLALLGNLERQQIEALHEGRPRKSVVFSYWVKMLDLVSTALQKEDIVFQRIDGQQTLERRQAAIQDFNDNPDCTVLLASIGSSAEGVNLTAGSTVHLLEPQWNPMVEAQAVDRVYRIGQTQEVTVIRYIVPGSIETYVQMVQQDKLQLVNSAVNIDGVAEAELETHRWKSVQDLVGGVVAIAVLQYAGGAMRQP